MIYDIKLTQTGKCWPCDCYRERQVAWVSAQGKVFVTGILWLPLLRILTWLTKRKVRDCLQSKWTEVTSYLYFLCLLRWLMAVQNIIVSWVLKSPVYQKPKCYEYRYLLETIPFLLILCNFLLTWQSNVLIFFSYFMTFATKVYKEK